MCPVCALRWPVTHDVCPNDGAALTPVGGVELAELARGARIGEYAVVAKIGEGGMAHVYAAEHVFLHKKVAIKVIRAEMCGSSATIQRFLQEARTISQIGHPNIVDVHAYGTLPDGRCYFIMQWLLGETLATMIEVAAFTVPEAAVLLVQICDALHAAHLAGVVHRDLKPENVYVVTLPSGHSLVKVLDFGIAKLTRPNELYPRTRTGHMMGTPEYVSPEQARGEPVDPRSDIYSLGVLTFEMLTRRLPFLANNDADMMVAHLKEVAPLVSTLRPDVPPPLDSLVAAMMSKTPNERPSMETIRGELVALAGPMTETASGRLIPPAQAEALRTLTPPMLLPVEEFPARARRRWAWIALAAASVTFVAGVAAQQMSRPAPPPEPLPAPSLALPPPPSLALPPLPEPAPPAPSPATLSLRVVPPTAKVTVDRKAVELRDGRATLEFDTEETHQVVAAAASGSHR